ncbi:hypothetical protein BFJ66_g4907 [Fusarium oxysporum f. sp. cepae]|uniref:Uncharacterized protein n=1 Tax=Fusarium oxysporum f. sp. cepae TaxID=396571 RepID=A0A3L6NUB7_FUSOX|nr:hypothetical protein BFJ65_g4611 [Fusarium oxysporum f. sp. cepae]RKK51147.1 hypothetical protein BFJ67_g6160 [Fusarium oxysporum f. sp. cepae]RKK53886.1 hypothetical protein BFJ66_g4907 [Fusarium oxysporum f. sp. cepae]RKK91681.1 hypothetical protein BFJ71_g10718 [Fusarium oxysporum]
MAEQETSHTSHQARNNAPNRSQNEGQGSASRSRGGSGGGRRRGRGGRNRGQRQDDSAQVSEGRGNAPQTGPADVTIAAQTIAAPESPGASRGRRNRRGNRGGSRGQGNQGRGVFSMGPQRTFGGRLTTTEQPTETAQDASLSADAPEFVPGQPVSQRSNHQAPLSPQPKDAQETVRGTGSRTDPAKRFPSRLPRNYGNGSKKTSPTGTMSAVSAPKRLLEKPRSGRALLAGPSFILNVPTNGGIRP